MKMYKARMTRNAAGIGFAGDMVEVDIETLRWLIQADACETLSTDPIFETASVKGAQETAMLKKPRTRSERAVK